MSGENPRKSAGVNTSPPRRGCNWVQRLVLLLVASLRRSEKCCHQLRGWSQGTVGRMRAASSRWSFVGSPERMLERETRCRECGVRAGHFTKSWPVRSHGAVIGVCSRKEKVEWGGGRRRSGLYNFVRGHHSVTIGLHRW